MTDLSSLRHLAQPHPVKSPTGTQLSCRNWLIEAAYRMIQNNLDPAVAENPDALVVYGGIGKAARNWDCFEQILRSLRELKEDESLLIQSGKPVGVFRTHVDAPRVLIANSNLVPKWATWEHFHELDRKGLMMYGQMTAGSWIYIGSQGIVQGTTRPSSRPGASTTAAALDGQTLDPHRGPRRHGRCAAAGGDLCRCLFAEHRVPAIAHRFPPALQVPRRAGPRPRRRAGAHRALHRRRQGGVGRPARQRGRGAARIGEARETLKGRRWHQARPGDRPDLGARPRQRLPAAGLERRALEAAQADASQHATLRDAAAQGCATHVRAMLEFQAMGIPTVDYGNNIRQVAFDVGVKNAFDFPGFVPAYIRPLFCRGKGPFRWVALSGDPEDIRKTDAR